MYKNKNNLISNGILFFNVLSKITENQFSKNRNKKLFGLVADFINLTMNVFQLG